MTGKPVKTGLLALCVAAPAAALPVAASAQEEATAKPAQDSAWLNKQMAALAGLQGKDGWQWMPGGLMWRRVAGDGSGEHPAVTDQVTVHYAGTLTDGTTFDSSYNRGEPATFPLSRLIQAWQMAIPHMGVGDTIELAAPSSLAYGPKGKGPIPGGATLFFKVELLEIPGR